MAVRLSVLLAGRPLLPRKIPGTHFCQRLSRPQGHGAAGRIRSIERISMALVIESATFRLVAQCLNHLRYRVPQQQGLAPLIRGTSLDRILSSVRFTSSQCTSLTSNLIMREAIELHPNNMNRLEYHPFPAVRNRFFEVPGANLSGGHLLHLKTRGSNGDQDNDIDYIQFQLPFTANTLKYYVGRWFSYSTPL
jgi:hypothetical protein